MKCVDSHDHPNNLTLMLVNWVDVCSGENYNSGGMLRLCRRRCWFAGRWNELLGR